jgi:hypothetical protein
MKQFKTTVRKPAQEKNIPITKIKRELIHAFIEKTLLKPGFELWRGSRLSKEIK